MSYLSNVTTYSGTGTIDFFSDLIHVNASNSTDFTITFPFITTDGIRLMLIREDTTSNIVTITSTPPNNIIRNLGVTGCPITSGTTGDINIPPNTNLDFHSYNNNWYLTQRSSTQITGSNNYFSSVFRNDSNSYISFNNTNVGFRHRLCQFNYSGVTIIWLNRIVLTTSNNANVGCTGIFDLTSYSTGNTGTVYGTVTQEFNTYESPNPYPIYTIAINNLTNLPTEPVILEIGLTIDGPFDASINVHSCVVR